MYRFEIFRYDASKKDDRPRFDVYNLTPEKNMSVLEALLKIADEQDPSLAFRYACRGAVCGSCSMSINGKLNLACRVQLAGLGTTRVVVEPMPNLEIIRDLVVDMDPFWEKYERVRPWLHAELAGAEESRVSERQRQKIDQYVNCILCGLCYAACPVLKSNTRFTGPAALAKLYRFLADVREQRDGTTLEQEDAHEGAWGCHTITRCID
ncbi:MAG: succinate dehydrogenase/fumarate reductase iron-sulfur subunit, partial [Candidatus Nealsonbacteria bacterium]|nr:succinate dehydrogenase/fumarate reductase iron-sulfur subunit [Candidatus Nealsonbacteria bacterium]